MLPCSEEQRGCRTTQLRREYALIYIQSYAQYHGIHWCTEALKEYATDFPSFQQNVVWPFELWVIR